MNPRLLWRVIIAALWVVYGALACSGSSDVIGKLDQAQGSVERDYAARSGEFNPALPGAEFRVGDAVKTAPAASAVVALDDGSQVALEENTLLRFSATPPGERSRGLDVEAGVAVLEAGARELRLHTSIGLAVLDSKTRLRIAPKPGAASFVVAMGAARFETASGVHQVAAGDTIDIAIGGAVLEPRPAETVSPAPAQPPPESDATVSIFIRGLGARARRKKGDGWRPLAPGATQLEPGSSLELGSDTSADLASDRRKVVLEGKGSFIVGAEDAPFIQATSGRIAVAPSSSAVSLDVPGGTIVLRPQSRAEIEVGSKTKLRLGSGSAEVQTKANREVISAGESADLTRGGELRVNGRGPGYTDMLAAAGTSFVVHDPHPPTAIGLTLDRVCERAAVVERLHAVSGKVIASARGETPVSSLFPAGTHRYRVRCVQADDILDEPVASGTVTVVRDSGNRVLSRVPPMTRIDMDGRTYTVTYQNLLPKIAVRWAQAPKANRYTLSLESRLGKRSVPSSRPAHTFAAGQLGEGSHTLQFSTGQQTSPATKLLIRFENAAPTARILAPRDGAFRRGEAVTVTGVAVPGWSVSAAGRDLALDEQSRFSEQVTSAVDQRALQLGFTHPERGTHYYLRRAAGVGL